MSGARAWRESERAAAKEGEKGRVETTKVRRYRPGKVPEWMAPGADTPQFQHGEVLDPMNELELQKESYGRERRIGMPSIVVEQSNVVGRDIGSRQVAAPTIVLKKNGHDEGDNARVRREPRVVRRATVVQHSDAPKNDDGHDDIDARRLALKQRLMEEERERQKNEAGGLSDIEDSDADSDEYTTGSDESDDNAPLAKPVFVRKVERKTLEEREAIEREEIERFAQEKVRAARQAQETRKIAVQKIEEEKAQEEAAKAGPQGADEIVTDDEIEPEADYEKWKEREMDRLRVAFETKLKREFEEHEKEIWKNMSDSEKERYLADKTKRAKESHLSKMHSKKNWSFLQKYYHKGAFFQDEAEYKGEKAPLVGSLKERDVSAPTGDDVFDKNLLPEVMRVKNFGKRSQSKWTHLAAEDTTRQSDHQHENRKLP